MTDMVKPAKKTKLNNSSAAAAAGSSSSAMAGSKGPWQVKSGEAEPATQVVILDYDDLIAGKNLLPQIKEAFGTNGLGICAVRGIPGLAAARADLLPKAWQLGHMPVDILEKYERPDTLFQSGWSKGREKFQGKPDNAKGSFYANPLHDDPADGDEGVRATYPWSASRNIWPDEVPGLEQAFKTMGKLIYDVARPVVVQCEALVSATHNVDSVRLVQQSFDDSRMCLGRLLHYYANNGSGSWCGWHNDNSVITGLVPAMFMNDSTGEELPDFCSETAGLFVKSRNGSIMRVRLPADCLGLQIGEAAQIISGGVLQATPHCVYGHEPRPDEAPVSRETFAMFIEPQWDAAIGPPAGVGRSEVIRDEEKDLIPPLSSRWQPDDITNKIVFGQLLGDSFQEYFKHNNPEEKSPSNAPIT